MTTAKFTHRWLEDHRVDLAPVERSSIVGIGHVLDEIDGLLRRLADPDLVREMGIEMPRGILFYGEPGVGKTLVARYFASRLGDVPCFEIASDELSPDRIRGAMRTLAERHERSVLYLDEIDVFAESRLSDSHTPETRAVLVATMSALDGLVPLGGPILIASTNRHPQALDRALLRSGRIGIHVRFDLPAESERRDVFRLYLRDRPVDGPIDLGKAAKLTRGHTPADIRAMVDDGYGLAVAAGRRALANEDLVEAVRRAGAVEPDDAALDPVLRRRLAVHEAGHVAVGVALRGADWIHSVTLLPTGGQTGFGGEGLVADWRTADEVRDLITAGLGGIAAERLALDGGPSLGSEDDIEKATNLAFRLCEAAGLPGVPPLALSALGQMAPETLKAAHGDAIRGELDAAMQAATAIVASRLDRVEAFAAALEGAGQLVGPDLAAALDAAFGAA